MLRETTEPTLNKWGDEVHPAFGMIGASRVSHSPPGSVLFDSDIKHQHTVIVRLATASRKRDLNQDWLHGGEEFVEIELSEAQWASFVSSMNVGSGVPCTIRRRESNIYVDGMPFQPRLAESMREVHEAADKTFVKIKEARDAYEKTITDKAPAKERKAALSLLHYAIENATSNVDFTGKRLAEHAENVVQRARADIEAFVSAKALQLGLDPATVAAPLELMGIVDAEIVDEEQG